MILNNNFNRVSLIKGQSEAYIYNILNDINKFKILLVFLNKGFTWHRELTSFGLYKNVVAETLTELNNLGLIKLKELSDLEDLQYESLINQDIQHYYKIYFTTDKIHDVLNNYNNEINLILNSNSHLKDFINDIKNKLKPFMLKYDKIKFEENNQLIREITLNGVTFEKETLMSKEVKQILKLTSTKKGTNLILNEIKPLALMSEIEKKRHINKIYLNSKETNHNIFREIEEQDQKAEEDFKTGFVGKSSLNLDLEREKEKSIFDLLGVEE